MESDDDRTPGSPAGPPDETPYKEEVGSFVDALESLLQADRGLDSIGPADIARAADRTVALFFQCFQDEHGPMALLVSRRIADRLETSTASFTPDKWKTASLHEVIRSAVGYLVALVRPDDPVSLSAAEVSLEDADLMNLRRSALTFDLDLFRRLLAARSDELPDSDAEHAVSVAAHQLLVALDREMLLGGDDTDVDELNNHLVEVVERLVGLRGQQVALTRPADESAEDTSRSPVMDDDDDGKTPIVVLAGKAMTDLIRSSISDAALSVRVVHIAKSDQVLEAISRYESPAVFLSWVDKEEASREVLHRVGSSAWLSSTTTVVLTGGSADELSMAYALGARVAVTAPDTAEGFVSLLGQIDRMLGAA